MAYSVKEIFYTLQGEGIQSGRPAVFCRFSGCNLWNGREEDRADSACYFCDTDFLGIDGPGGGRFTSAAALCKAIQSLWPSKESSKKSSSSRPFVVFTGGEPLLQLNTELLSCLRASGFEIAVETNGTLEAPEGIDWICVSPKPNSTLVLTKGDELKLVYPHEVRPESVAELDFKHFLLSPLYCDSPDGREKHLKAAIAYCQANPQWRLTMQCHKSLGKCLKAICLGRVPPEPSSSLGVIISLLLLNFVNAPRRYKLATRLAAPSQ
ncbi:UNVERIFIED_CONTAM: hypothetical protein GTU68_015136 [Idotea baltica]|nr:hypothetical protein [Idotea baltica]